MGRAGQGPPAGSGKSGAWAQPTVQKRRREWWESADGIVNTVLSLGLLGPNLFRFAFFFHFPRRDRTYSCSFSKTKKERIPVLPDPKCAFALPLSETLPLSEKPGAVGLHNCMARASNPATGSPDDGSSSIESSISLSVGSCQLACILA